MPAASARPTVAVAVVSWNTRELLESCLTSLHGDHAAGRAEVWVVDNASHDGSAQMVRKRFPWVRLEPSDCNLGFGAAVNIVAARTDSVWIAPANADIAVTPGALAALMAAGERDPSAAVVAPRLLLPDGSTQHSVYRFPTLRFTLLFNSALYLGWPALGDRLLLDGYWDSNRPRRVDWAVGAFLLVRRTAWGQVGGFDARQWMYAEDLDLAWRLAQAGWRTRYVPDAHVLHHHSAAARAAWGDERTRRWVEATYSWMLRRHGVARTRVVAALNIIGGWFRAALELPGMARRRPQAWAMHAEWRRWARLHAIGLRSRTSLRADSELQSPSSSNSS